MPVSKRPHAAPKLTMPWTWSLWRHSQPVISTNAVRHNDLKARSFMFYPVNHLGDQASFWAVKLEIVTSIIEVVFVLSNPIANLFLHICGRLPDNPLTRTAEYYNSPNWRLRTFLAVVSLVAKRTAARVAVKLLLTRTSVLARWAGTLQHFWSHKDMSNREQTE